MSPPLSSAERQARLRELAALFLRLSVIGFGGPAAHTALMERELVRERRWFTQQQFLDMVSATNLIPGPNSTELAMHIGLSRAGQAGLWLSGACFILPAALLVLGCSVLYVRYGQLPQFGALLYGIKPVIIVVVVQALVGLGRAALKNTLLWILAVAVLGAALAGFNELLLLLCAGLLSSVWRQRFDRGPALALLPWSASGLFPAPAGVTLATAASAMPFTQAKLFWFFAKVGSVLFGSGYVLLAFLRADLVERWHWLTEAQLLDAIAIGQVTPGPVFTTATFIGYLLGGTAGAGVATAGIFLPAFLFVGLSAPYLGRLRASASAGRFLDGLNAASLALMAAVTWRLGASAVVDWSTLLLAGFAAVLLWRFKVSSTWLVLGGGLAGILLRN